MEHIEPQISLLKLLSKTNSPVLRETIITHAKSDTLCIICEIAKNLLSGNVPLTDLQKSNLKKYKSSLRLLGDKKGIKGSKQRKEILKQKGGAMLPHLLSPFLRMYKQNK